MKEVFVSHRGALRPHSLLQAAEQSVLQTLVECVSRQAGRQRSWFLDGRCSSHITHLCSRDSAALCLPGVLFNHWRTLYYLVLWRCVCVCVCVYLVQSPMLLTYVLHSDLLFGFTVVFCAICNALLYASTSVNAPPCFKYIAV